MKRPLAFLLIGVRVVLGLLWTTVVLTVEAIGFLFLFGSRRGKVALRAWIVHLWARGLTLVIGMRIRTSGKPPLPPFCLVSNHLSYLDVMLLGSRVRAAFVSRADISGWPLIGFLAKAGGTLFINREQKKDVLRINEEMEAILLQGGGIAFFPEGTTSKGDDVHRFKASLLDLPARLGTPVAYATISYATPRSAGPADEVLCWWGNSPFGPHVLGVLGLTHFYATIDFGPDVIQSSDRKELAAALEQRVRERFHPLVAGRSTTVEPEAVEAKGAEA